MQYLSITLLPLQAVPIRLSTVGTLVSTSLPHLYHPLLWSLVVSSIYVKYVSIK